MAGKGQDESAVLKQCLDYLKMIGIYCWRNNTGATKVGKRFIRYGFKGSSDILGLTQDGRFLAVECKRENGGVLSDYQKEFLFNISHNGGVAIVANSLDTLIAELKKNNIKVLTK